MEKKESGILKDLLWVFGTVLLLIIIWTGISNAADIKADSRRSSVQILFHTPVLKVYFIEPLKEERVDIEELLGKQTEEIEKKIEEAIEKERKFQEKDRYGNYLTEVDVWGWRPTSQTFIPLGAIPGVPKDAKFPERVIVVAEIKTDEEVSSYRKEHEKDIETISETLDVSKTTAKSLISNLSIKGYTINKQVIKKSENVKLLWFDDGWSDTYPKTLDWCVEVEEGVNLIIGYSNGVLETKPVPQDGYQIKRVHVEVGYLDLKAEFKDKPVEVTRLENQVKRLKKELDDAHKELYDKKEDKKGKRDISKATWYDVMAKRVKVEEMWLMGGGSGVFLGNMQSRDKFDGWAYKLDHNIWPENKGVILTNAHVAQSGRNVKVYVTEDKETMYIMFPGFPFIRYTADSDYYGSPASQLIIDGYPVMGSDVDAAILLTSAVPEYDKYRAELGNSDAVREGLEVVVTGNPSLLQKFTTTGVVSNTNYNFMKAIGIGRLLSKIPEQVYRRMMNTTLWIDCPALGSGSSGSGVIALEGSEKGKVIALMQGGLMKPLGVSKGSEKKFANHMGYGLITDYAKYHKDEFFKTYSYKDAVYDPTEPIFLDNPELKDAAERAGYWIPISGMNCAIPINKVKAFLQERGLVFDDGVDSGHWLN